MTLLKACGKSGCQDPRDKVYALLGLASDCRGGASVPDYSKTTFEVYWDVMWFYNLGGDNYWAPNYYFSERFIPDIAATTISWSCYLQRILGGPLPISESNDKTQNSNADSPVPFTQRPDLIWFTGTLRSTIHSLSVTGESAILLSNVIKSF